MRIEMTPEQREDLQKIVAYATATQFGEVPKRTKAITNVIAMHIEDFYLNGKIKKTT